MWIVLYGYVCVCVCVCVFMCQHGLIVYNIHIQARVLATHTNTTRSLNIVSCTYFPIGNIFVCVDVCVCVCVLPHTHVHAHTDIPDIH